MRNMHCVTVTVVAPEDQLASFVQFCKTVEALCRMGSSRTVAFPVDGDGAADMRFDYGGVDVTAVQTPAITDGHSIRLSGIGY